MSRRWWWTVPLGLALAVGVGPAAWSAAGGGGAGTPAAAAEPAHRPLRSHVEPGPPNPTEPLRFAGYPRARPFSVVPQKNQIALYPCSQCHQALPPNPTPRKLEAAPHVADLPHGNGRLWCLNCHTLDNRDTLTTLRGEKVDFDDAHLVCGQCHSNRHRDWYFGAHGKRAANWKGERVVYNCTHCHDAHNPALQPRAPSPPPPVRAGLQPMPRHAHGTTAAAPWAPGARP